MKCVHCDSATVPLGRWSGDGETDFLCRYCAISAMAHGHKHVHVHDFDCRSHWSGPGGTWQVDCPAPVVRAPERISS